MAEQEILFGCADNPFDLFKRWYSDAETREINDPNAMALTTVSKDLRPSTRIVLLKDYSEKGFTFFTNKGSRKSEEIRENQHIALCFHWKSLRKQIRIEGLVEEISEKESDDYFKTRPRAAQIGAWASKQSQKLQRKDDFFDAVAYFEDKFAGDVPRPDWWGGYRVIPDYIEFWVEGKYRYHQRLAYHLKQDKNGEWGWDRFNLYP
jgi:pyridoxamine 5'-phosphate oxidase